MQEKRQVGGAQSKFLFRLRASSFGGPKKELSD